MAPGVHRQTGTPINEMTETGTEMHGIANAGPARGILPVGRGRLSPHVPWILTLLALVNPFMGGSTGAMMMPVQETTAGKIGIGNETGTETGIGIVDTTDEMTPGHPGTSIAQTVPRRVEEDMVVPGKVTGAVVMTTEEKETGSEGGAGTATINGPEIVNMIDAPLPRPIVLHHYRRAVVSPLLIIWMHVFITC